jgi:hypothetical protein
VGDSVAKWWWAEGLKGLFALALVFWPLRSGKLDPASLRVVLHNWPEILGATGVTYARIAAVSFTGLIFYFARKRRHRAPAVQCAA